MNQSINPLRPRSESAADTRHESKDQRMDRNWSELLQELRVMQTGVQIIGGFLLTLPFQHHVKERLVAAGDVIVKIVLGCVALLITGCAGLIFSVVAGHGAGLAAGGIVLLVLAALVLVYPLLSWRPGQGRLAQQPGRVRGLAGRGDRRRDSPS